MIQQYENYTTADQEVWALLFNRQLENLRHRGSQLYLNCLKDLSPVLNAESIPNFEALSTALQSAHGWQIEVVKGMIPVDHFFELLTERKFCSSTWVRQKHQIEYLEEPDMFHDIFGHIPLLMHREFSEFATAMGQLGCQFKNDQLVLVQLQRLYWFTVEFGLINEAGNTKCYGAGIMSSYGETNHIFDDPIEVRQFDLDRILGHAFVNDEIQNTYYLIESFEQLYESIKALAARYAKTRNSKTVQG